MACFLTILALGFFWTVAALSGQSTQSSQPAPSASAPKTAEQVYKNIQVLKGIPADQLVPTMTFITASLGVDCEFCHAEQREKDDKKTKLKAREMIQMQMAINKENFEGRNQVTCNSCHQGRHEPIAIPVIADEEPKPEKPETGAKPEEAPTADQLINKYVQALGGAEVLEKITSRVEKGTISIANGPQFPIDLFAKAPNRRMSYMHTPRGDSITAFDGTTAWLSSPGAPLNKLDPANSEAVKLDAEFNFALHIKQIFTQLHVGQPEKIRYREANVILALQRGQPPVRLYFDKETGLLVRLVRYVETALGRLPTQIDYADYRDFGGVKIPYRWTIARPPRGRFTIQVDQVQQNVPIDDEKFAVPMSASPQ
ncbi:MAG TPA: c-type cytochrome [Candidatus Angelobacter sp.]